MANKLKKKPVVQKVVKKLKPLTQVHADKPKLPANVTMPKGEYVSAVGRRKTATATVRIYKEAGDFIVNNKVVGDYFANIVDAPTLYTQPFVLTDTQGKYAVMVKVNGSGTNAQLDASLHGIARALIKLDPEFRPALKAAGFLSRDDRMKETRKIGTGGKARRAKQSPKR